MSVPMCVICGEKAALSGKGDHVPPKNIYTKSERTSAKFDFHTVPACLECNGGGSKYDEHLKIVIGISTGDSRDHQEELVDSISRTIGHNKRIASEVFSTAEHVLLQQPSGDPKPMVAITFDFNHFKTAIQRICRAMYWRISGEILHKNAEIELENVMTNDKEFTVLSVERFHHFNGDTFLCKLVHLDKRTSLMVLLFFGSHPVFVRIKLPECAQ
ncbi:hypothetical protein [Herminiimonas aquatilis]|uniref:HNH endonuclease n=1 Tax=Herminiimonas aquatilis TaxID=345342 RepID=A0ABW2J4S7_9BURK